MFSRIAVVNRGESAARLITAVNDLRADDAEPITIALHTAEERNALFVRQADEAFEISSPNGNPYLDYDELERVLIESGADAAWVGWGFVAEHPEFADMCERIGVTFIGPPGDVMRKLGDKIGSKLLAEENNVPVAPWSGGAVETVEAAREVAERIGLPLMVKATAGGGGRGIRRVDTMDQLDEAFERARAEAAGSFGNPIVFMERVVTDARHIEVQVACDNYGNAWALGVRDCSVQRRNQKIIEESHSPVLTAEESASVAAAAVRLVKAADYRNVGTVEFLYQPATGEFAFLEVNTRLQVEHPVTEVTTGVDLVRLQLQIAARWKLGPNPPAPFGHAIEMRLNAEDPQLGFSPAPGKVTSLRFPGGPGIRVDTGYAEGDTVPSQYDSMIAKIIASGVNREEARKRLRRALNQTIAVLHGGATNKSFVSELLDRPEYIEGRIDTAWLDKALADGIVGGDNAGANIAVVAAAIDAFKTEDRLARVAFLAAATRGRPQADAPERRRFELRYGGERYEAEVGRVGPDKYRLHIGDVRIDANYEELGGVEARLTINGHAHKIVSMVDGPESLIEIDGNSHRVSRDDGGAVRAAAPSLVVKVVAEPGTKVRRGDPLVIVEAMKVETALDAPFDGEVVEVLTAPNTQVDAGAVLVKLEAADDGASGGPSRARLDFSALTYQSEDADVDLHGIIEDFQWYLLGFDPPRRSLEQSVAALRQLRASSTIDGEIVRREYAALQAFADVAALSRNRPASEQASPETHSPQEYFHRYLRSLNVEAEGLSPAFVDRLGRAFRHFHVDELDRSKGGEPLEEAAFRIFVGQHRAGKNTSLIEELLNASGVDVETLTPGAGESMRQTLDDLVIATQLRYPSIGETARNVKFATFSRPQIEQRRHQALDEARGMLRRLSEDPDDPNRDDVVNFLAGSPYRLIGLIADRGDDGVFHDRDLLVDVLTRRNYWIRGIQQFSSRYVNDVRIVQAQYERDDAHVNVLSALAVSNEIELVLTALSAAASELPTNERVVIDLFVRWPPSTMTNDQLASMLNDLTVAAGFGPQVDRINYSLVIGIDDIHPFTFRRTMPSTIWNEDVAIRGMHPTIAQRLQLRRLRNFQLERLPSPVDTYLFRCTGKEDDSDVRLYAAAEVRDVTTVRDNEGRIVDLPELEHVLTMALDGLRAARNSLPPREQPSWNRVLLYIWPVVDVPVEDFDFLVDRLMPLTTGLGLEEVRVIGKSPQEDGTVAEIAVVIGEMAGGPPALTIKPITDEPIRPLDAYANKLLSARRRGAPYPYEIVPLIKGGDNGRFTEYDFIEQDGRSVFGPVERDPGNNQAGVVVGLVSTPTERYPEGMERAVIMGDPTKSLGNVSEPECSRILAILDLAEQRQIPVEWFALSSGARIAMDSGTENMDWISRVLRRIIEFTQAGHEINIIVTGINVGAQPYWNAEATMLMHTKGILVMTPDSAMVLTGKQALDYSGGVSAEDNFGIGGFDRIMGPNGQAQYWAPDLRGAVDILFDHYGFAYVAPGERFPRQAATNDPLHRDVTTSPHNVEGLDFATVGDIFSDETNPGKKKPFDIRALIRATADQDHEPLERWAPMRDAESVVVFDAYLGGQPVAMVGVESKPQPRYGRLPADGPDQWTAGTLFPLSSKKMARGINAASGSRPLVVLANLSGFDGSPESLRRRQLEFGAEIGRAVVNFDGPIVFCVVSRFHGGAFVVFSSALNDNMTVLAVEGTYASVLGGAPAAAVVFTGDVNRRVASDKRVVAAKEAVEAAATGEERSAARSRLTEIESEVRAEKLGEVATEFDAIHSIQRAQEVGSVDAIIPAAELRPRLIAAVQAGMTAAGGLHRSATDETTAAASSPSATPPPARMAAPHFEPAPEPETPPVVLGGRDRVAANDGDHPAPSSPEPVEAAQQQDTPQHSDEAVQSDDAEQHQNASVLIEPSVVPDESGNATAFSDTVGFVEFDPNHDVVDVPPSGGTAEHPIVDLSDGGAGASVDPFANAPGAPVEPDEVASTPFSVPDPGASPPQGHRPGDTDEHPTVKPDGEEKRKRRWF